MISAVVIGHLGADPEAKQTQSGTSMARLRIASSHGFGDRKTSTWVSVTAFGKAAEFCTRYLRKGDQVVVTGKVYMQTYTDKQGVERQALACDADSIDSLRPPQERRDAPSPADTGDIPF